MVVAGADAVREVALRQRGGKDKGQLSESFWSCTQADDIPAMMIESRNAIRASSTPAIEVTRPAIIPVSGTFADWLKHRHRRLLQNLQRTKAVYLQPVPRTMATSAALQQMQLSRQKFTMSAAS